MCPIATVADFQELDLRVGCILTARLHPSARKPAYQLTIDFGELGIRNSSAQLTKRYKEIDLVGRQIIAVLNLPPRRIAGFVSEVLVLGAVHEEGDVILLTPESPAIPGDPVS